MEDQTTKHDIIQSSTNTRWKKMKKLENVLFIKKHLIKTMELQNYRLCLGECQTQTKKKPTNTNPRYKHFVQTMFTAGDTEQFNRLRVKKTLLKRSIPDFSENVYNTKLVFPEIWEKNRDLSAEAVNNTFLYLFHKFKKGIFVRIYNNKLECFIPFSNAHYYNEFSNLIRINPKYTTVAKFLEYVASLQNYKFTQKIKPVNEWFANNSLIRFDYTESDNNTASLYDLLKTLCENRIVPDVEFFINRRDYPQFRKDGCEPYDQIYGEQQSLLSHNYEKYSPIIGFSGNNSFADILMPTYEDWARAVYQETGKVFPYGCQTYSEIVDVPWKSKINKAVFRGSTTGTGVSNGIDGKPEPVNQRLSAYIISQQNRSFIDYGITKWNLRPRKLYKYQYLETIEPQDPKNPYFLANRLNLQQQSEYKYILNLEGNVAAYRLSYELSSGSVILLAKSKWKMWYNDILIPYTHYVPVEENLEDLITQIIWCKENDKKCAQIALNAKSFYNTYLGTKGILDFWQARLWHMSEAIGVYSYFPDLIMFNVLNEVKILNPSTTFSKRSSYSNQTIQKLNSHRCIGLLKGIMKVFQNSSSLYPSKYNNPHNLSFVKQLYKNTGSVINLYTLHGFNIIGKTSSNDVKLLENAHESFIGIKTINALVAKLPHFCYVFGSIDNTRDTPKTIFLEYINGISLFQWLKSPQYNFKHLLSILVQLNLALYVAQNSVGFVHNDLYPWNIMLSTFNSLYCGYSSVQLSAPKQIHYYIDTETILSMSPEIIPVMVDYGKSRAVVFEKDWGLIDHGFSNSYRHGQLQDTLSLLYSVLNVLMYEKRLTSQEAGLLQFAKQIGLQDHDNIERWSRFGMLFDFTSHPNAPINKKNNRPFTPKHFVDFILTMTSSSQRPEVHKINLAHKHFNYVMEYGPNPLFVNHFLKTGNRTSALYEVVKNVNYSRFTHQNSFFTEIQKSLFNRHLLWLNSEFDKPETPHWLRKQWVVVSKVFDVYSFAQHDQLQFDLKLPKEIYFNEHISLETILKLKLKLDQQDWITIIDGFLDAYLFRAVYLNESYLKLFNTNRFELINQISSHCTLNKIKFI